MQIQYRTRNCVGNMPVFSGNNLILPVIYRPKYVINNITAVF